jgi:hypothetical protein
VTNPIHKNKERFNAEVAQIRNRPDYSTEAKRRYLEEAYARAKAEHDRMVAEHKKEQQRSVGELERMVFEVCFPLSAIPPRERDVSHVA